MEHINGGTDNKYRQLSATSTNIYPFINSTLASLFDTVTIFNSYNKTFDVYNSTNYGKQRNIILSLNNIVTNFQKTTDVQNVVTRLHGLGQNNLVFTQVNPLGTDYIDDMTPFRNTTYMSKELLEALDRYDKVTEQLFEQFKSLRSNLSSQQVSIDNLNEKMDSLKANKVTLAQEQSALLKTLSDNYNTQDITISDNLKDIKSQIETNEQDLTNTQNQLTQAQNDLDSINAQLDEIGNQYDKSNTKDENGLIFTPELLDEYDNFILEDTYQNASCTTPEQIYSETDKELKKRNTPTYTINLTVDDFLESLPFNEEEKMNITLNLGDLVRAKNKDMNFDKYVRFVGYSIAPANSQRAEGSLELTFSTTNSDNSSISALGSAISKLTETAHEVDINKYIWNLSEGTANWVEDFRTKSLDLVAQAIRSKNSNNQIDINENGIYLIDSNNTQEQLALVNNIIAMTTDGWDSAEVAITPKYINGKLISAESIAIGSLTKDTQNIINSANDTAEEINQQFTVFKGEVDSKISKKIGAEDMWSDLQQNPEKLDSVVCKTHSVSEMSDAISENTNTLQDKVNTKDIGTEIVQNATDVIIAWNKGSSSIDFTDGEIVCKADNGSQVTISGDSGITYTKNGQKTGFGVGSFVGQTKMQNGN